MLSKLSELRLSPWFGRTALLFQLRRDISGSHPRSEVLQDRSSLPCLFSVAESVQCANNHLAEAGC